MGDPAPAQRRRSHRGLLILWCKKGRSVPSAGCSSSSPNRKPRHAARILPPGDLAALQHAGSASISDEPERATDRSLYLMGKPPR